MGNFNNENLIPFTGELKPGQRLLKRPDGYFIPVGASAGSNVVAGYFADKDDNGLKFYPVDSNNGESVNQIMIADTGENEPEYEGNTGNAMDFYKCASVTSDGWTGYKAILNNGVYGFEQNVTSGLNYTSGFIPEIGKIYVDGAMIKSELYTGIPINGLVFYAPLELDVISSQTDQLIVKEGSGISYQIYKNIPCVRFTSESYIKIINNLSEIPSGSSPFTISAWCCLLNKSETYGSFAFGYGGAVGREAGIWFSGDAEGNTNNIGIDFNNNQGFAIGLTYSLDTWYHCCLVWDGALLKPYINGIAGITASRTVNMDASIISIGVRKQDSQIAYFFDGYVAGCRIYNRALNETEILSLASEFTPIA